MMAVRQRAVVALPMLTRHAPPRYHAELPSLRRAFSLYEQINITDNVPADQLRFQHLSIFKTLRPIPEGYGSRMWKIYIEPVKPEIRTFVRSMGIKLEAVDSRNAALTYNILNEEGRIVAGAAALIPYGADS